jgi:hypothetical protein
LTFNLSKGTGNIRSNILYIKAENWGLDTLQASHYLKNVNNIGLLEFKEMRSRNSLLPFMVSNEALIFLQAS